MNTFDLLDKLNLPVKIGLEGDEAMLNRMTIMDAYLSAAALQSNRGSSVNSYSWSYNDRTPDFLFSQPQQDFGGISQFDLFKLIGADGKPVDQEDSNDTRISLDLSKFKDLWQIESDDRKQRIGKSQDDSKGHDQVDTESDSYNRFEIDLKQEAKLDNKRTEKKPEKSEISNLINDERRRLLKKLNSCDDDRIVFKRREKNSKKDPKANTETYRGSRFWGVSKNKSKWQVMITLNHFKDYKGGFDCEEEAARMYDRKSICTFGLKAKTNFDYTKNQVLEILRDDESIIL